MGPIRRNVVLIVSATRRISRLARHRGHRAGLVPGAPAGTWRLTIPGVPHGITATEGEVSFSPWLAGTIFVIGVIVMTLAWIGLIGRAERQRGRERRRLVMVVRGRGPVGRPAPAGSSAAVERRLQLCRPRRTRQSRHRSERARSGLSARRQVHDRRRSRVAEFARAVRASVDRTERSRGRGHGAQRGRRRCGASVDWPWSAWSWRRRASRSSRAATKFRRRPQSRSASAIRSCCCISSAVVTTTRSMLGFLALGLAAFRRDKRILTVVLVALAVAVKLPAVIALVYIGWAWAGRGVALKQRLASIARAARSRRDHRRLERGDRRRTRVARRAPGHEHGHVDVLAHDQARLRRIRGAPHQWHRHQREPRGRPLPPGRPGPGRRLRALPARADREVRRRALRRSGVGRRDPARPGGVAVVLACWVRDSGRGGPRSLASVVSGCELRRMSRGFPAQCQRRAQPARLAAPPRPGRRHPGRASWRTTRPSSPSGPRNADALASPSTTIRPGRLPRSSTTSLNRPELIITAVSARPSTVLVRDDPDRGASESP